MEIRRNLVDDLRQNQAKTKDKTTSLSDLLHLRKPIDVNKDVLEGNPNINSVLNSVNLIDARDRDENIYHKTQQERLINDKRYRSVSTESSFTEYRDKR